MAVLLISGSREGFTYHEFDQFVRKHFKNPKEEISLMVAGGAAGVDTYARMFATKHNIQIKEFFADWDRLGNKAGILRNIEMADFVHMQKDAVLLAMCYNYSRGTSHMMKYAKQIDLPLHVFHKEKDVAMFD